MNRDKAFMYIGASILIGILILLVLARPAYQDMTESKDALDELKVERDAIQQEVVDTKQLIADYNNTSDEEKDAVAAHIPDSTNQAGFIAQMEAIGKDTRAFVEGISFTQVEEEDQQFDVGEINASLTVTGEYGQINDFLVSLEQNKRITTIRNVAFETDGAGLVARIDVTTYFRDSGVKKESTLLQSDTDLPDLEVINF